MMYRTRNLKTNIQNLQNQLNKWYKLYRETDNNSKWFAKERIEMLNEKINKINRSIFFLKKNKENEGFVDLGLVKQISIAELMDRKPTMQSYDRAFYICPLHNEKTGSFVHYKETNSWYCFSKDTEILTEQGFLYLKNLVNDSKNIKVASLNLYNQKVEYKNVSNYYKRFYNGKLYNFHSKQLDVLVSPEHKMLIQTEWNYKFNKKLIIKETEAKNVNKSNRFLKLFNYTGSYEKYFYIPKYKDRNRVRVPVNNWLEFFGYWLADGHTTKNGYTVVISVDRKDLNYQKKVEIIISKLGFKYNISKYKNKCYQYIICNIQLGNYLKIFGKAKDKYIPIKFKNYSKEQLKILFDSMYLEDGNKSEKVNRYNTISKKLANDFQEISIKIGLNANVSKRKNNGYLYNGEIRRCNDCYNVNLSKMKKSYSFNISKIEYNDYIYNLTVEPYHSVFIRRNGKCCWTKQCFGCGQGGDNIDLTMKLYNLSFSEAIKKLKYYI